MTYELQIIGEYDTEAAIKVVEEARIKLGLCPSEIKKAIFVVDKCINFVVSNPSKK